MEQPRFLCQICHKINQKKNSIPPITIKKETIKLCIIKKNILSVSGEKLDKNSMFSIFI